MVIGRWVKALGADRDDGVSTIEVTIVFPFVWTMTFLILYACFYEYTAQVAMAAAEEGARAAAQSHSTTPLQDGYSVATTYIQTVGGPEMASFTAGAPTGALNSPLLPGQFVISVQGTPVPLLATISFSITQTAVSMPEIFTHG